MLIKDILTIDLSVDIKNVIDLEDVSETAIQSEIEHYIVTDGLAKEYADFVSTFTSNIIETGVWISGFYGSGKSYFGKLLGYLLSNRTIAGTPARDRIFQRFNGINDEALIKNTISKLNTETCRVVFLDVAKQDTSKGFAFTLFRNFLKSLDLPENEHGFLLFQLMINEQQSNIHDFIYQHLNIKWSDLRSKLVEYAKASKAIFVKQGYTDKDYDIIITTIRRDIDQFSASRLKEELSNYLQISKQEKIILLFDEASEAISRNKFDLLDLEGVSEALSSLAGKVWTIAIAQEKLDDVINNSRINRAQLTKVTDRFKTKIHLESTEVDIIIRNRLLRKTDEAVADLKAHYQKHSGKIADHAALNATGINKTDTSDSYITYYPFYKYQFDLLQNFLFGTKGYATTKVAARGMIITTYDILKQELQNRQLYYVATGWQITKEAQPQPPVRLVNRYDNAEKILKETGSSISGRHLLETLNFLTEAEVVPTTLSNIVKSYTRDPEDYYKVLDEVTKALNDLVEAKLLLSNNNTFRITSDIEQRLLDEMKEFSVAGFLRKKQVVAAYKGSTFIKTLARITDSTLQYDFYITTDNDDELTNPNLKQLRLRLKSVYNISDNRTSDIESLKTLHQNDKDLIYLIPDNSSFLEIDKLADEIERISILEKNYQNPQADEGPIVRGFSTSKTEKESRLKELIEQSLQKATAVYLYNTFQLNKENWQTILQSQQRQAIQNVYSKRLESQLSDTVAAMVIKEANGTRLSTFFHGKDFLFFDANGNFIGDKLKVSEEILYKTRNTFIDGKALEKELEQPPTGFTFGTVISTVAALMRAGKLMAKHNGVEKFSWRDEGVKSIFDTAAQFRNSSFKAISKSLTLAQKNELVTALQDLKCEDHIGKKIDWNINDFELVNAVRELARHICDKVDFMQKQVKEFNSLFADIQARKETLSEFTGTVSEANYMDRAESFLNQKDAYSTSVQIIDTVGKFIHGKLPKLIEWKTFSSEVNDELIKAARSVPVVSQLVAEFNTLYSKEVVKNYGAIQQVAQKIKDEYYNLMQAAATDMAIKYTQLKTDAEALIKEIDSLPAGLNESALYIANGVLQFAMQRTRPDVDLGFDVKDKNTRFTYSEMLSFIELYESKKANLENLIANLVRVVPPTLKSGSPAPEIAVKSLTTRIPQKKLKVGEYKRWLQLELQKLSGAGDNDDIEISIEN